MEDRDEVLRRLSVTVEGAPRVTSGPLSGAGRSLLQHTGGVFPGGMAVRRAGQHAWEIS